MLDKTSAPKLQAEIATSSAHQQTALFSRTKETATEYQLQARSHQNTQPEHDSQPSNSLISRSNVQFDDRSEQGAFWLNDSGSPCFSNVDQLLSPGFYIPENVFQPFFPSYDNGAGMMDPYDQYSLPLPLQ